MDEFITTFPEQGDNVVEKVRWEEATGDKRLATGENKKRPSGAQAPRKGGKQDVNPEGLTRLAGKVWINKEQYFEGVPKEVWEFHIGGYQVCEKWLKDRKGRELSNDDLMHYQKVVVALNETIRLKAEEAAAGRKALPYPSREQLSGQARVPVPLGRTGGENLRFEIADLREESGRAQGPALPRGRRGGKKALDFRFLFAYSRGGLAPRLKLGRRREVDRQECLSYQPERAREGSGARSGSG